jgi:formate hydrogenlyase subunit 3/multisubunit Na+/H+ antiporter MnhD subunit
MNDPAKRPLLADIRAEVDALVGELRHMAAARLELARLELKADIQSVKRLAIAGLAAAVMALAALPLLAVCLAELLATHGNIGRAGWLLIFGVGLLFSAIAVVLFARWRFRRQFVGLQETLEELREDLLWLRETGGGEQKEPEKAAPDGKTV